MGKSRIGLDPCGQIRLLYLTYPIINIYGIENRKEFGGCDPRTAAPQAAKGAMNVPKDPSGVSEPKGFPLE